MTIEQIIIKDLEIQLNELKTLVEENFIDEHDCRYDHKGWCQTHNLTQTEDFDCPMPRIRKLVEKS